MPLVINQGVQDTKQDNKFDPILAKGIVAQITEIKLADSNKMPNTLEITFRILAGEHKNRFFWDRVTFDAKSDFSWKYRSLRKAAGVPYTETEPKTIDIEKLLLDKAITVDLGIRKGKNKDGDEQEYQNVVYKVIPGNEKANTKTKAKPAEEIEITDFVNEVELEEVEVVKEKPKAKAKTKPKATKQVEIPDNEDSAEAVESTEVVDVSDEDDWAD